MSARFCESVREPEAAEHARWLEDRGIYVRPPRAVNEGEGDFIWTGERILAGTGFRSSLAAQNELRELFNVPVVALELVDQRFYHLDTALTLLDSETIAYYPPAFSESSRQRLATLYPSAILADEEDALVLGLNAISDGRHVVMSAQAKRLAEQFARAGFEPVPMDVSELLKAGGGVKCATLELHASATARPWGQAHAQPVQVAGGR